MFCIAFKTPLPLYLFKSPSRSSTASLLPVLAPEGTEAWAVIFLSTSTSAKTVGFPLESRISFPIIDVIKFIFILKNY